MPHPDPVVCQEMVDLRHIVEQTDAKLERFLTMFETHLDDDRKIAPAIQELLRAWEQGTGMVNLIKYLAYISAFLGALAIFIHDKITWK